jgi:hypothetical protein
MKSSQKKSKQTNQNTMKLTTTDYKNILKFYKIDIATLANKEIKEKAEHILAVKLCKCIKNVRTSKNIKIIDKKKYITEKRAIAICYNSVLKRKKLKIFKFNCKKTARLSPKKGTRKIFVEKLGI